MHGLLSLGTPVTSAPTFQHMNLFATFRRLAEVATGGGTTAAAPTTQAAATGPAAGTVAVGKA